MASNTDLNDFFSSCIEIAAQQVGGQSSVSPTTTLVSPASAFSNLDLDEDDQDITAPQSRLSNSYPAGWFEGAQWVAW